MGALLNLLWATVRHSAHTVMFDGYAGSSMSRSRTDLTLELVFTIEYHPQVVMSSIPWSQAIGDVASTRDDDVPGDHGTRDQGWGQNTIEHVTPP